MTTDTAIKAKELVKELGANKAWRKARLKYLESIILSPQKTGYWQEIMAAIESEHNIE